MGVTRMKSSGASTPLRYGMVSPWGMVWQVCYPKVDETLGAHIWGLSAWVDRRLWETFQVNPTWLR